MKKFKQFKSEQQHITEVGPYASAMMVAMGAFGLVLGGWKLFKKGKEKIKGWKEKIDEVASPSHLKDALKEIEELKLFKMF